MWKSAYNLTRAPQPPLTPRRRTSMRNRWRALAERRQLLGLTTRGTVPKRRLEGRLVLAELDALAASLVTVYDALPAKIQARCLALADRLAAVRKRLA